MRENLRRAIAIALVVGTILVLINHGDHIELEPICDYFFAKCMLSYLVPFSVSMVSGVMAARRMR
ncbi:MAG: nitrate/nitrite transporter NrtS [Myxococcota bacterium]